jgi:CRISPR system Cascade subunit CasB
MSLPFRHDSESGKVLRSWWDELQDKNKGSRAELRRCQTPAKVSFVRAYHTLFYDLQEYGYTPGSKLSAIAALAAHVKDVRGDKPFAQQMAAPKVDGGTAPQLSELRFRRLLQYESIDELFPPLRRAVHLLGGNINLYSLANSVYRWGDRERRQWAYAYYGDLKS